MRSAKCQLSQSSGLAAGFIHAANSARPGELPGCDFPALALAAGY